MPRSPLHTRIRVCSWPPLRLGNAASLGQAACSRHELPKREARRSAVWGRPATVAAILSEQRRVTAMRKLAMAAMATAAFTGSSYADDAAQPTSTYFEHAKI